MTAIDKAVRNITEIRSLIAEETAKQNEDRAKIREAQSHIKILRENITQGSRRLAKHREDLQKYEDFLKTADQIMEDFETR